MNDGLIYQPKGGMCRSCKYANRNCSYLDFSSMPRIAKQGVAVIVKCTAYEPKGEKK